MASGDQFQRFIFENSQIRGLGYSWMKVISKSVVRPPTRNLCANYWASRWWPAC